MRFESLLGLLLIANAVYVLVTAWRNAETWEHEGYEPRRITLVRPDRPRAAEIRIRGTVVGLISVVFGLLLLGVFH
jgi:hypothetical protein